ncbi:GntR family transcriptional regulator [Inhella gelatinilytica]|uniref:GntR family transcriptional regulator n=1 Tax=Inhella gelatinilytica TaxID=2795030 RepID=A0A931NBL3_9BURK|nr:GntR family transcriptional regulator [Inhella gelatinilytica]MBH9553698.1 GntR family transcriptional regulator [Inhella gelatinilytica]
MPKSVLDFRADEDSSSPLYLQLATALARAISEGRYQANEALPSERVLAEELNLSRVTARKAIERLVEQGLIVRKRGSGNYIAPRLEQPLTRLSSFSEELHQRGFVPQSRWLTRGFAAAGPDEQIALELRTGERVARLERQRLADGVVMAFEVSVLPQSVLPDPEAVTASLYAHLTQSGQAPVRALQHIRALNADAKLAGLLEVPVGAAVLFITRVGYVASGKAVEMTHSYCRSDYYDFVAEMRREPA